ncbi:MAG: chorismate-binding protein [Dehalococcoidia bacterium]
MLPELTDIEPGRVLPSFNEFAAHAETCTRVPVWAVMPTGGLSPADTFERVSLSGCGFLMEGISPEPGTSRYSYVSASVDEVIRTGPGQSNGDVNPAALLRRRLHSECVAEISGLPDFYAGALGYVAYEAARHFEPSVSPLAPDPAGCPESAFFLPAELVVFDHMLDRVLLIVLADVTCPSGWEAAYTDAAARVSSLAEKLRSPAPPVEATRHTTAPATHHVTTQAEYERMVEHARAAIIDGELIQVVVSQRLERPTSARPLDIYRELRRMNPSPYTFLLDFGDFQLVGASPELLVRVRNRTASIHPIAGTRQRGETPAEDAALERELVQSEKERAEHLMLLDLCRNDLGRVCAPGTVSVPSLMAVEHYSHVMHLVSRVQGRLREGCDALDAFAAGFPAGTLTGAPKVRAMQLISELEPGGRGPYCGGVGWFGANGDMDTGTVIRSILLKDGVAHVQGGGGIVFDSVPGAEYRESLQKAAAPLRAIAAAETAGATAHEKRWRSPVSAGAS